LMRRLCIVPILVFALVLSRACHRVAVIM